MRHHKKKKLGKGTDHRRKLLRSLASAAMLYEKIETSYANARAVKPYLEKLITRAKNSSLHSRRLLLGALSPMAAKKALEVIGPKFKDRKGGYTRLTKLNNPHGGQSKVLLEFVE
ncbi:MAG: 50S ribosomal protein L17 [Patescibacteria group bacterium]|nr:50S ribosomal protein L17 [Patescibacteria group bacterium]